MSNKKLEKFLCLILRHSPERIKAKLDSAGWINTGILVSLIRDNSDYKDFSLAKLKEITDSSEKQRFEYKTVGWSELIRARQGHSIPVDLGYQTSKPPEILYHGSETSVRGLIFNGGIKKMKRHAIHLYSDKETVINFSQNRRSKPCIFAINSKLMFEAGHQFYRTENDVWLVDYVAPQYILSAEEV